MNRPSSSNTRKAAAVCKAGPGSPPSFARTAAWAAMVLASAGAACRWEIEPLYPVACTRIAPTTCEFLEPCENPPNYEDVPLDEEDGVWTRFSPLGKVKWNDAPRQIDGDTCVPVTCGCETHWVTFESVDAATSQFPFQPGTQGFIVLDQYPRPMAWASRMVPPYTGRDLGQCQVPWDGNSFLIEWLHCDYALQGDEE
jgi:hypothetical protein